MERPGASGPHSRLGAGDDEGNMVKGVIFLTIDERAERVTLYFVERLMMSR